MFLAAPRSYDESTAAMLKNTEVWRPDAVLSRVVVSTISKPAPRCLCIATKKPFSCAA
jgi:hypothetical protein